MSGERPGWTDTGRSPTAEQAERLLELFETLIAVLEEIRDQHRLPPERKDYTQPPSQMFDYVQGQDTPPSQSQFQMARHWLANPEDRSVRYRLPGLRLERPGRRMTVADTLRAAADLIERTGLARGAHIDTSGRIDAMEAIWRAATGCEDVARYHTAVLDGDTTLDRQNAFHWAMITMQRFVGVTVPRWSDATGEPGVIGGLRAYAQADENHPGTTPDLR